LKSALNSALKDLKFEHEKFEGKNLFFVCVRMWGRWRVNVTFANLRDSNYVKFGNYSFKWFALSPNMSMFHASVAEMSLTSQLVIRL
jgi:hypothetical protein